MGLRAKAKAVFQNLMKPIGGNITGSSNVNQREVERQSQENLGLGRKPKKPKRRTDIYGKPLGGE